MAVINIFNITTTPNRPKPFRLKWTIDGRHKSRSFNTLSEAQRFKRKIETAREDGYNFDPNTGLPDQWVQQLRGYAEVAAEYSASKWNEWQATSRSSFADAASVVIFELIRPKFKNTYDRFVTLKVIRDQILNQNTLPSSKEDIEIKNFVLENSYRLKEITPEIVSKTIQAISITTTGKVASKDTQRRRKQTLGAVMDYAFRHRYINDNPYKRVKVKSQTPLTPLDPTRALTPQECRNICTMLRNRGKTHKGYYMQSADYLEIIWLAGLRPSEVAGLQVKHIKLFSDQRTSYIKVERAVVTVNRGYADDLSSQTHKGLKSRPNNSFRTVPILAELRPTLERLIEGKNPQDYLFTSPKRINEPIKTDLINDYFRKVCSSVHTPYDLRHTNASILIYSGLNVIEVANRLGNSIEVCQKVYLHMINRIEDINTSKENAFLESTKNPLNALFIDNLLSVSVGLRD
jgi:integrase